MHPFPLPAGLNDNCACGQDQVILVWSQFGFGCRRLLFPEGEDVNRIGELHRIDQFLRVSASNHHTKKRIFLTKCQESRFLERVMDDVQERDLLEFVVVRINSSILGKAGEGETAKSVDKQKANQLFSQDVWVVGLFQELTGESFKSFPGPHERVPVLYASIQCSEAKFPLFSLLKVIVVALFCFFLGYLSFFYVLLLSM